MNGETIGTNGEKALLREHEIKYMTGNSDKSGERKTLSKTISGYYIWIHMPNIKMSIVKTVERRIDFLISPAHSELLPAETQRYEWNFDSETRK